MYKLLLSSLLLVATPVLSDPALSTNIDDNRVTVSGISAGGQMAHQLHIAYSDLFSGEPHREPGSGGEQRSEFGRRRR